MEDEGSERTPEEAFWFELYYSDKELQVSFELDSEENAPWSQISETHASTSLCYYNNVPTATYEVGKCIVQVKLHHNFIIIAKQLNTK